MFNINKPKESIIKSEEELRKVIPQHPSILNKRIQPSLDYLSKEFISLSCIAIFGSNSSDIKMEPIQCDNNIIIKTDNLIEINNTTINSKHRLIDSTFHASLLFMAAGVGHNLRANGLVKIRNNGTIQFHLESVYFHCARAMARSQFWTTKNTDVISEFNIIKQSPYALLKTINNKGNTEISPRGDQPGFIKIIDNKTLFLPERPGNKVAVSLRNVIQNPSIELLLLVPQSPCVLNIKGKAYVINDKALLQECCENGKKPKTGLLIKTESQVFGLNQALIKSELWNPNTAINKKRLTPFPKALSFHMNGTGIIGKVSTPIITSIIKHDMKNLY